MNTARDNNGQKSAGIWQNLRLVPLFSLIFGGILLLFALCIGVASYFLISGNHSLDDATDEIQVRMGLSNSSNHLRTARLTIIQAGAAARIGEMDEFRANIAAAEKRIQQAKDGFAIYQAREVKTPADMELDATLQARFNDYITKGLIPMIESGN